MLTASVRAALYHEARCTIAPTELMVWGPYTWRQPLETHMTSHCLQIIADPDNEDAFRWIVLEQELNEALVFKPHSESQCDFDSWAAALDAGTLALAAAEGRQYENEAADPVGDADCSGAE